MKATLIDQLEMQEKVLYVCMYNTFVTSKLYT